MKEWDDKYNSFNSDKGLMYKQWYDRIIEGRFLPPIEVSVDPVNDCNLNCFYCNSRKAKNRGVRMTRKHLLELCDFFYKWGAKAVCFAGGGEPTMHEALADAIMRLGQLGLPTAIITNGLFLNYGQMNTIAQVTTWCGVSVDCANAKTYKHMKGEDRFDEVISNIKYLISQRAREVTFKFLIHPDNQYEIYDAVRLATSLKCNGIHIRPISFLNYKDKEEVYDLRLINKQLTEAFEQYGDKINIYAISHKFDDKMHVKFPFTKCRATPIMPIFQANGFVSLCIDRKGDEKLFLCKHDPVEEVIETWGSEKHKLLIDSININECPKCTFNRFNEQIEKCIIQNKMTWQFT